MALKWFCRVCGRLVTEGFFSTTCPGCQRNKAGSIPANGPYAQAAANRANVTCKLIINQGDNPNIPLGSAPNTENGICAAIVSEWLRIYYGRLNNRDTCLAEFSTSCGPEGGDNLAARQSMLASKNQAARLMQQQNQATLLQMGNLQQDLQQIHQKLQSNLQTMPIDVFRHLKAQFDAGKQKILDLSPQIHLNTQTLNTALAQEQSSKTGYIPNIVKTTHANQEQANLFTMLTGQAGYRTISISKTDGSAAHALGLVVGNGRALFMDPNTGLFSDSHADRIKAVMTDHMANLYAAYDGPLTVYQGT